MIANVNERIFDFWNPRDGRVFEGECYALDTETELIDEERPQIIPRMVIAAVYNGEKAYFLTPRTIAAFLRIHADLTVVMHNAAFDLAVIKQVIAQEIGEDFDVYSLVDAGKVRDTQILHRLYDLATKGTCEWDRSSLEKSCREHLGIEVEKDIKDESGQSVRKNFGPWLNRPADLPAVYLEYLLGDVVATYQLFQKFKSLYKQLWAAINRDRPFGYIDEEWLRETWRLHGPLTHDIQLKAAIVLGVVTRNGLCVDTARLEAFRQELLKEQQEVLEKLLPYGYRPGKGSVESLQRILRQEELNNKDIRFPRTETGKISTKAEHLELYEESVPFIGLYLRIKTIEKLLGTFLDKMQKGVLHPKFDILKNTGRTSAFGDISPQNLPRDKKVRNLFVSSPGHIYINADYTGIEMATHGQAILLQFGGYSELVAVINSGVDMHRFTASRLTGKPEDEITGEERRKAKAVNFGFPGGMGAKTFREHAKTNYGIDMTEAEAEENKEIWLNTFPEMRDFLGKNNDKSNNLGEAIDRLLKLDGVKYARATGQYKIDKPGILGWMARKVFSNSAPQANFGDHYTKEQCNYFWSQLDTVADRLSEKHRDSVRRRVPSPDLAAAVSNLANQTGVLTLTGRLRANATFCASRNTIFQGPAADGAKLAMWKLMRSGFRIVNFIHDEFLIEVPEGSDYTEAAETIKRLMIEGMREVVPDVRIDVKVK